MYTGWGKKKIFFHISCTLLGQCRCCSWVFADRLSVFTFYTLLGGGGWGGRRDYKGRHQLTWDHSAELLFYFVSSSGQALFSVFSRFCSTKTLSILESFSLFSLTYAEAKKLCFPVLSRSSMRNFPLIWAIPHRSFVWNALIKKFLCLCKQPSTLVCLTTSFIPFWHFWFCWLFPSFSHFFGFVMFQWFCWFTFFILSSSIPLSKV